MTTEAGQAAGTGTETQEAKAGASEQAAGANAQPGGKTETTEKPGATSGEGVEGAGETAGNRETGTGAETADKADGDLTKALNAARAELRIQKAENERLKTTVGKRLPAERKEQPASDNLDLKQYAITQDDLDKSDVEAINRKQQSLIEAVSQRAAQQAIESVRNESSAKSTVDDLLGRYEIFGDDDEELATAAQTQALLRLNALPDKAGMVDVEKAVEAVAKQFSQYKVTKAKNEAPEPGTHPLAVGAGTAEATHMKSSEPRPKTDKEAKDLGAKLARNFQKTKGLLWD